MTSARRDYRRWLPGEAIDGAAVHAPLADALGHWSARWFAGAAWAALVPLAPVAEGRGDGAYHWSGLADGVALGADPVAADALAAAMLGGAPDGGFQDPADLQLVDALAAACLADLHKRIARLFRLPPDSAWLVGRLGDMLGAGERLGCAIGPDPRRPLLTLVVERDLLIDLIRSAVPAMPRPVALRPVADALALQPIMVGAMLGRCELSLAELDALVPGDVLVLDRPLALPLDILVDGRPTGRRCGVEQASGRLALELLEPFVG